MKTLSFTKYDYEYLLGLWDGPLGAAFNVVAEDCMEAGWGYFGHPTKLGKKLIAEFERDHVHYVEPEPFSAVTSACLESLQSRLWN